MEGQPKWVLDKATLQQIYDLISELPLGKVHILYERLKSLPRLAEAPEKGEDPGLPSEEKAPEERPAYPMRRTLPEAPEDNVREELARIAQGNGKNRKKRRKKK